MSNLQQRQALLTKLGNAKPLDDPTAFVLLWTYFEEAGLSEVENNFILQRFDPVLIDPIPRRTTDPYDPDRTRAALAKKKDNTDFDRTAVAWLKGIDRLLEGQRGTFETAPIQGYDGRQYRIRGMNNFIARYFAWDDRDTEDDAEPGTPAEAKPNRELAGNRKRSLSLSAYCRAFRAVPTEIKGIRIEGTSRWGNPSIHDRLHAASESGLRFLAWPLRYDLRVERWLADDEMGERRGKFLRVNVAADRQVRGRELATAIDAARRARAAILVFPELSTAVEDVPVLQELLAQHDFDDFPILTIAGVEHQHADQSDVNEAVVLGPDGENLHRHVKLTRYSEDDGSKEWITTGTVIHVLESPIGNLAPLICLDLFNESIEPAIAASHANVLLVPSLSSKTSAHAIAAYRYLNINLAATIVCNRSFDGDQMGVNKGRAETFSLLPGKSKEGKTLYVKLAAEEDYLLVTVE